MTAATWWDVGQAIIVLAAVVTALGALGKSPIVGRPVRWFGRMVIVDPLGRWMDRVVRHATGPLEAKSDELAAELASVKKELHPNGGSSFRDEIRRSHERIELFERKVEGFIRHEFIPFAQSSRRDRAEIRERQAEMAAELGRLRSDPYEHLDRLATDLTSPPVGPAPELPYEDEPGPLPWSSFPPDASDDD